MRRLSMKEKEIALGGIVVKSTKVKFFYKGDTLVYNADAFQLAEGSMLDALISQLPGVELKDDGRIYVNGRFVDNLLLNGKDFFKGKNEVLLENLPAYTVKNLKVYEEESDLSKMLGTKVDEGRYVMDVQIKREYEIGWFANAELGGGTEDRYLGRLFALRFTPNSRLSFLPISTILMTSASPAKTESGHRRILMAVLRQPKWEASITIYRTNGKDTTLRDSYRQKIPATTIKVGENNRIFFRMVIHTIDRGIMPITRKQKY